MKERTIISLLIVSILLITPLATADSFPVNKKYSSIDTLHDSDAWNVYKITADSDMEIVYSFTVQGPGTIMILLVIGHSVTLNSDYLVTYSQETPTKSFSDTYSVRSSEGSEYSLLVLSDDNHNITYAVNIEVRETPLINYVLCGLFFFGLIFGGAIVSYIVRSNKKKKMQSQRPYQYPPQPQYQPPPAQPQAQEVAFEEVEVVEPVRTQPPPPPPPPPPK
jgi:hypothetical protein